VHSNKNQNNSKPDTNYILIVSTGKNDLQVLGKDSKGKLVSRPTGHGGRLFHTYFLKHADVVTEWEGVKPKKESRRN